MQMFVLGVFVVEDTKTVTLHTITRKEAPLTTLSPTCKETFIRFHCILDKLCPPPSACVATFNRVMLYLEGGQNKEAGGAEQIGRALNPLISL